MTAAPSWPRVLLRSEDSDHHLSVIETAPAPGVSPPLHAHDFDETFYVMEGELIFRLRDEYFTVGAGQLAFAPRGVPHTYANLSGAPAQEELPMDPHGFAPSWRGPTRKSCCTARPLHDSPTTVRTDYHGSHRSASSGTASR